MSADYLKWTGPTNLDTVLCKNGVSFDDIEKADYGCPNAKKKIFKVLKKIGKDTEENCELYDIHKENI